MHSASRSASTRTLLCALAFALWVAATLGIVHRALHVPASGHTAMVEKAGLLALFGDHTDAECRLYDQLTNGPAAPGVPLIVLPVALPAATFAWLEGEALARWVALFDARGPPSTR